MKRVSLILAIVIIIAIGAVAWAVSRPSKGTTTSTSSTSSTPSSSTTPPSTNASPPASGQSDSQAATITYSESGFSPATLTVKAGTTITIKNDSNELMQFDSDPHPEHTDDPELNVGSIVAGDSKTIKVTVTGTHGFHNHLKSSDTGTLIVQ